MKRGRRRQDRQQEGPKGCHTPAGPHTSDTALGMTRPPPRRFLICNTGGEDWAHFPELQRGLFYKIILEKHIRHDASILGHLGSYNHIRY